MSPKKQKKILGKISEILVVNNKKLTPYIELANFSYQNIDQAHLGTLLGIFEIKDTSADSAYIVNFLASVAKKTYFSGNKKTATENFENTLSRINLSLSEIAKHGNVNWIGKLDAVLCSVSDDKINFTVSGDAKILLLRDNKLVEISNGLSSRDEAGNPLKTFTDIASGKLKDGDKLILTTDDISHIFNLSDLEKYALSFSAGKFARFLKTALLNELEIAGTIIFDAVEKITTPSKKIVPRGDDELTEINAFSNKTFEEKNKRKSSSTNKKSPQKNKEDFEEKKSGHIYLKDSGENDTTDENDRFKEWLIIFQEKLFEFNYWLKDRYLNKGIYKIKKHLSVWNKKIINRKLSFFSSKNAPVSPPKYQRKNKIKFTSNIIKNISFSEKINSLKKDLPKKKSILSPAPQELKKKSSKDSKIAITDTKNKNTDIKSKMPFNFSLFKSKFKATVQKVNFSKFHFNNFRKYPFVKKILPSWQNMRKFFREMTIKQRLASILIVIIIFIAPLIFFKISQKQSLQKSNSLNEKSFNNETSINPNSDNHQKVTLLLKSDGENVGVFSFGGAIFTIKKNKLIKLSNNKQEKFLFPEYFGEAKLYSFMSDLNLLFLIDNNNKLISFSPVSKKFKESKINIPAGADIKAVGTYLTYIYLADASTNQIYRYPRADGGFGDKTDWLKERNINLNDTLSMAIDGNIYLLQKNNKIIKLEKGRFQDFPAKIDSNSKISKIFTSDDFSDIYLLDNLNGEIIALNKANPSQIKSASNEIITSAKNFTPDKKHQKIYIVNDNSLFEMPNNFQ